MSQLQDVSFNADEREFLRFRASVLTVLSARPELRRLGVLLHGDDGFRLIAVDGVSRVLDLWSWVVANAPTLVRNTPQAAALIIPHAPDGAIHAVPSEADLSVFDLDIWMVDDRHRVENLGIRCVVGQTDVVRLPWHATGLGSTDAVAALLGRMLSEHHDPPPAPMRLHRPARHQPLPGFETMAIAA